MAFQNDLENIYYIRILLKISIKPNNKMTLLKLKRLIKETVRDSKNKIIEGNLNAKLTTPNKDFKVVTVSSNTNSFGLYGVILMAKDGEAWQIGVGSIYKPKKGDTIKTIKTDNGIRFNVGRGGGYEIPEKLESAPPEVAKQVWESIQLKNLKKLIHEQIEFEMNVENYPKKGTIKLYKRSVPTGDAFSKRWNIVAKVLETNARQVIGYISGTKGLNPSYDTFGASQKLKNKPNWKYYFKLDINKIHPDIRKANKKVELEDFSCDNTLEFGFTSSDLLDEISSRIKKIFKKLRINYDIVTN